MRAVTGSPRGRWAAALLAGSLAMLAAFFGLVAAGQRGGETFFSNPLLAVAILTAAGLGLAGGVTGVVAALKDRDRGLLTLAAIAWALLVAFFAAGELLAPH